MKVPEAYAKAHFEETGDLVFGGANQYETYDSTDFGGEPGGKPMIVQVGGSTYDSFKWPDWAPTTIPGDLDLSGLVVETLPENLHVKGDASFDMSVIVQPPANMTVDGNLGFEAVIVNGDSIEKIEVHKNANLINSSFRNFPESMFVDGDLTMGGSESNQQGKALFVGNDLSMMFTPKWAAPETIGVKGDLLLAGSKAEGLPNRLNVAGTTRMGSSLIESLPERFYTTGSLSLTESKITELPSGMRVGGDLDLAGARVSEIPEDLRIGKNLVIDASRNPKIPVALEVGGVVKDNGPWARINEAEVGQLGPSVVDGDLENHFREWGGACDKRDFNQDAYQAGIPGRLETLAQMGLVSLEENTYIPEDRWRERVTSVGQWTSYTEGMSYLREAGYRGHPSIETEVPVEGRVVGVVNEQNVRGVLIDDPQTMQTYVPIIDPNVSVSEINIGDEISLAFREVEPAHEYQNPSSDDLGY